MNNGYEKNPIYTVALPYCQWCLVEICSPLQWFPTSQEWLDHRGCQLHQSLWQKGWWKLVPVFETSSVEQACNVQLYTIVLRWILFMHCTLHKTLHTIILSLHMKRQVCRWKFSCTCTTNFAFAHLPCTHVLWIVYCAIHRTRGLGSCLYGWTSDEGDLGRSLKLWIVGAD